MDAEGLEGKEDCPSIWQIEACSTFAYNELMFSFRQSELKQDVANVQAHGGSEVEKVTNSRPLKIIDLPPELLELILRKLSFDTVGKIRVVCQYFNTVASSLLNSEFSRLRLYTHNRFQSIKAQMPRRESARRKHPLARESDIIETLHMRLTLLHMTFGKHIKRKHCCFFAGGILDEVYRIINYTKVTPSLNKAYKVTDELFDLSTMAMEYFKEHIEPSLPEITYFAADFLEYAPTISPLSKLSLLDDSVSCTSNTLSKSSNSTVNSAASSSSSQPKEVSTVAKRMRKLRDIVKKNNGQVSVVKRELKLTKKKVTVQEKHITDLKSRQDDNDRKFQNMSRKLSAVLQELNRCKTELQYWRSKSPAAQCSCGKATPILDVGESDYHPVQVCLDFSPRSHDEPSKDFKPISPKLESLPSCSSYLVTVPKSHDLDKNAIKPVVSTISKSALKFKKSDTELLLSSSTSRKRRAALDDHVMPTQAKKVQMRGLKRITSFAKPSSSSLADNIQISESSSAFNVCGESSKSCVKGEMSCSHCLMSAEEPKGLPDHENLLLESCDTNSVQSTCSSDIFSSIEGTDEESISSDDSESVIYSQGEEFVHKPQLDINVQNDLGSGQEEENPPDGNRNLDPTLDASGEEVADPHMRQILAVKHFLNTEIKKGSNLKNFRSDILHLKQHLAQQAHKLQMDIECAKNE